jgi:probable rRNA maturation factor
MPNVRVSITNLQPTLPFDADRLRRAIRMVFEESVNRPAQISVAIVDDATIHDLNNRHLQHDYPTDVLSYPLIDSRDKLVGEIVVSAETARQQAPDYGWSADEELCLYVIHGALHLAGFRDKSIAQRREMQAAERWILRELGIVADASAPAVPQANAGRPRGATRPRRHTKRARAKGRRPARDAT